MDTLVLLNKAAERLELKSKALNQCEKRCKEGAELESSRDKTKIEFKAMCNILKCMDINVEIGWSEDGTTINLITLSFEDVSVTKTLSKKGSGDEGKAKKEVKKKINHDEKNKKN